MLRTLYGFYGMIVFSIILAILFPFYIVAIIIGNDAAKKFMIFLSHRIFAPTFFALTLIKVKGIGKEKIDTSKSYVIISNHPSSIDFMANTMAYPGYYKYLVKKGMEKYPIMGYIIMKFSIIVNRKDTESRRNSLALMKKELDKGYSVFVYPEGTRNTTDQPLAKFYSGAFRLAIESKLPILIATYTKIREVSDSNRGLDLWPGIVEIRWSGPIETAHMVMEDYQKLQENVQNIMLAHLA